MAHADQHQQGVIWSLVGWSVQTTGLAGLWPELTWSPIQWGLVFATIAIGTLALGYGLAQIALSRGHTPAFAGLALANLVGLTMIALLPDLIGDTDERIQFECPHCHAVTWIDLRYTGKEGPCRSCGLAVKVPSLLSKADIERIEEQ